MTVYTTKWWVNADSVSTTWPAVPRVGLLPNRFTARTGERMTGCEQNRAYSLQFSSRRRLMVGLLVLAFAAPACRPERVETRDRVPGRGTGSKSETTIEPQDESLLPGHTEATVTTAAYNGWRCMSFETEGIGDRPRACFSPGYEWFFVLDTSDSSIRVYDRQFQLVQKANNSACFGLPLDRPEDLFADEMFLYVADTRNSRVVVFDRSLSPVWVINTFAPPAKIVVDRQRNVFVMAKDHKVSLVQVISYSGELIGEFGDRVPSYLSNISPLTTISGDIAIDDAGYVYVIYSHYYLVRKYTAEGKLIHSVEIGLGVPGTSLVDLNNPSTSRTHLTGSCSWSESGLAVSVVLPSPHTGANLWSVDILDVSGRHKVRVFIPDIIFPQQSWVIEGSLLILDGVSGKGVFRWDADYEF